MDRSLFSCLASPSDEPRVLSTRSLKTFDSRQQEYGEWFSSFPWKIFATGTFREKMAIARADKLHDRFFAGLMRSLRSPVAYISVREHRTSGLGFPGIPCHYHFLAAAPPHLSDNLIPAVERLWAQMPGDIDVKPYDSSGGGYYLAKLAGHAGFEYKCAHLNRLSGDYSPALAERNPYIPAHVRGKITAKTLVIREQTVD